MPLVSHDSTTKCHSEVTYVPKNDKLEKKNTNGRRINKDKNERKENNFKVREWKKKISCLKNKFDRDNINNEIFSNVKEFKYVNNSDFRINDHVKPTAVTTACYLKSKCNNSPWYKITGDINRKRGTKNIIKYGNGTSNEGDIYENSDVNCVQKTNNDDVDNNNEIRHERHGANNLKYHIIENKIWDRRNESPIYLEIHTKNALRQKKNKIGRRSKWCFNTGVLLSMAVLNIIGQSCAIDASSFSSGLTSRMIASFLGYPSSCTLGSEVRPCSLTLSCWLRGGTRVRGCGGWLFSCCGDAPTDTDLQGNSIPSSDWKYKPSPPKLRQVPQRSVMPNNVFRRRVDDDVTQLDCGLPSSRILQKRIIGGREARFAEFPWQAHVRISEFQCGGVLVSRRYVATAAHCVSRAHTRDIVVWLGAIDTSATHHPARKLGVIQKILHPLFQFRMTQPDRFDIALLKLSRPITYMSHILPICLPDHDLDLRGRSGVIAGWGKTDASNGHTGTNLLRSATVPILSKDQCINWHQSKQISVEIHSEMICAGHSDGHQDACLGDSGGPLIVLDNGRYYLVGITSAGFGCGVDHQPGIYHNVKLTANWIRSVITPAVNYNDNFIN